MNKFQEKIATELIEALKNNSGLLTINKIYELFEKEIFVINRHVIISELEELNLIDNINKISYKLKHDGWKFKSFRHLERKRNMNERINKYSLIIAFVSVLLNIFLIIQKIS